MATVGKNILDNLTTGMYSDSKVIYREYIQNACDQIDLAISRGILAANEGSVDIFIDTKKRFISIKDNATGVRESDFIEDVGDIANSNKEIGKNKGWILSILVDTFFARISMPKQQYPEIHNISAA